MEGKDDSVSGECFEALKGLCPWLERQVLILYAPKIPYPLLQSLFFSTLLQLIGTHPFIAGDRTTTDGDRPGRNSKKRMDPEGYQVVRGTKTVRPLAALWLELYLDDLHPPGKYTYERVIKAPDPSIEECVLSGGPFLSSKSFYPIVYKKR